MDINSLLNAQMPVTNRSVENLLNLRVGQQLDVKTIRADITASTNAITLSLGNKNISVQSTQPLTLNPGQAVKLQVIQIAPTIEFKIVTPLPAINSQAPDLRLKLISNTSENSPLPVNKELAQPLSAADSNAIAVIKDLATKTSLPLNQALVTKIVNISGSKILLQFVTAPTTTATIIPSTETSPKQTGLITIERSQLLNAPSDLKIGQNLNLEAIKTGPMTAFKVIPPQTNLGASEAKIAEFVKQFLPRHEAAPVFLNQLIKDLPQLMNNETVPQALKDIAAQIIQNLPPKEQLVSSQGLKQALTNSGLFLEAKLPAQAELIKVLPQLIKNESLPLSIQRIAINVLQNLTQKDPLLNIPASQPKPLSTTELAALKLNLEKQTATSNTAPLDQEDFKANLLKFIDALKQELSAQSELPPNPVELDLLKNLQTKTENTVAKIVLDQLVSLPKEESTKQVWVIDIPFLDRQRAESVRIEIQQDKENTQYAGNKDWSVNITITPPELGTIHCLVSYRNEVINTFFKSNSFKTAELIKHNLDYLKNQLEESGLKTGHLDAQDDNQKIQSTHQLIRKQLFDDKA
ncbi:MAG: flagellar hook-length control protein FliK [Methylobacter sp.]|nr:flagellar hook-length control protein FliK [Methylobacter sp.]